MRIFELSPEVGVAFIIAAFTPVEFQLTADGKGGTV